jgi:hypothetical protein
MHALRCQILLVAVALAVVGCSNPTEPAASVALRFQEEPESLAADNAITITPAAARIFITARYNALSCGSIAASAVLRGRTIEFRVVPGSFVCRDINKTYAYRAELVGLEEGEYRVMVTHAQESADPARAEAIVTVRSEVTFGSQAP